MASLSHDHVEHLAYVATRVKPLLQPAERASLQALRGQYDGSRGATALQAAPTQDPHLVARIDELLA